MTKPQTVKTLFGQPLSKSTGRSLTDQIYDILVKEIVSGRWSVGERLPSFNMFFEMSKISRYPLKTALDRLEKEGYIEKIRHKGIFVRSTTPQGSLLGRIVIYADSAEISPVHHGIPKYSEGFGLIDVLHLQHEAAARGYSLVIATPDTLRGLLKTGDIKGIISLLPIDSQMREKIKIPIVFLGVEDPLCQPCITGDNYTAIYRLTRALIDLGHQQVALFVPGLWSGKSLEIVIDAHTRALREAGLQFIPEAVEFSRKLDHHSLKSMKEFLQHFPDVTAILTTYLDVAIKMAEYADLVDWDIPGRLSLASLQTGRWGTPPMNIFGAQYDWDKIIRKAMELIIDEKFKINENGFSRLVMEPKLNHSQPSSIAPPPQPSK